MVKNLGNPIPLPSFWLRSRCFNLSLWYEHLKPIKNENIKIFCLCQSHTNTSMSAYSANELKPICTNYNNSSLTKSQCTPYKRAQSLKMFLHKFLDLFCSSIFYSKFKISLNSRILLSIEHIFFLVLLTKC